MSLISTETSASKQKLLSVIVPVYNESENIPLLYGALAPVLDLLPYRSEIIFVNDGSHDDSGEQVKALRSADTRVVYVEFARNFGKEIATTAGLHTATGDAAIMIDADLQHPPDRIPDLVRAWEDGSEIVIGIRSKTSDSQFRKAGSYAFHTLMNSISETTVIAGETDFRLIDRIVLDEFNRLTERSRMTRGLINWLGFRRAYVPFESPERVHGSSQFTVFGLFRLATSSLVQHSLLPLRLAGYLGVVIMIGSAVLGTVMFTDRYIMSFGLNFSGPAILADIILFLVGLLLLAIGMLAVYIGNIHHETQNRPLYIIRRGV